MLWYPLYNSLKNVYFKENYRKHLNKLEQPAKEKENICNTTNKVYKNVSVSIYIQTFVVYSIQYT